MSRTSLLLAPASLAVAAVIGMSTAGSALAADAADCGQPAVPAVYQTVHHDAVTQVVPGTSTTTWVWSRQVPTTDTAYERTTSPAQGTWSWTRSTPTTEHQYGLLVIDRAAQPAVPEQGHWVTTTVVTSWTYTQQSTGKTRCETSPTWNGNSVGTGWVLTGPCDTTTTNTWVVDVPAVPAVTELSHTVYIWVAEGDSAPAGYSPTGDTRPGDPVVETVQSATEPAGGGWVQGAFTATVPAVTEIVWVAEGDAPPADGTPTGATRPGAPRTETSARSASAPTGDGWEPVDGSAETTTTPDTTEVVTPAYDEQVLVTPAIPATEACTDPTEGDPDPGILNPPPADYGDPTVSGVAGQVLGASVVNQHHSAGVGQGAGIAHPDAAGLPNTGNPVDPWLLALGGSLVLGGTTIVVRSRRREA